MLPLLTENISYNSEKDIELPALWARSTLRQLVRLTVKVWQVVIPALNLGRLQQGLNRLKPLSEGKRSSPSLKQSSTCLSPSQSSVWFFRAGVEHLL
jgi:hypothetical protein